MNETNIFERATRAKLRFVSVRGLLTVEDLWDLPLTSKNGFDIDAVAKEANFRLKEAGEESFVSTKPDPAKALLELQMDVLKHIIAVRLQEQEAAKQKAERKVERARLLEALDSKQVEALKGLSPEEIRARIAEIDQD